MDQRRSFLLAFLAAGPLCWSQTTADTQVLKIPFEQWLSEKDESHFRWTTRIGNPQLTYHQRLKLRVEIQLDGAHLADTKGDKPLIFLTELRDSAGQLYRTLHEIERADVQRVSSSQNLVYAPELLIVPGDYRIATGIYDSQSGEHSVQQKMLHVAPLKNDPLPDAWNALPKVEFFQEGSLLDEAFLTYMKSGVSLAFRGEKRVSLKTVVNIAPGTTRHAVRTGEVRYQGAEPLLASMKLLAEAEVQAGRSRLALADITRRRVIFEQAEISGQTDWTKLRAALEDSSPNKIGIAELAKRSQNAQFFASETQRRMQPEDDGALPVVIVMSQVMTLDSGEDLHPIATEGKTPGLLFYLRFHEPLTPLLAPTLPERGGYRRNRPLDTARAEMLEPIDSLAPVLKNLHPRIIEIYAPEQFRKALRTIMDEVAKL